MLQILEFLASLVLLVILYHYFLADKLMEFKEARAQASSADKIARMKVLSDDPKEIEKFIISNAASLSDASMNSLLARLETLHAEKVINDDSRFRVVTENMRTTPPTEDLNDSVNFGKALIERESQRR